jgi:hypothetical protein
MLSRNDVSVWLASYANGYVCMKRRVGQRSEAEVVVIAKQRAAYVAWSLDISLAEDSETTLPLLNLTLAQMQDPEVLLRKEGVYRCIRSKFRKFVIPPLPHLFSILLSVLLFVRVCIETLRIALITQWGYDRAAVSTIVDVFPANTMKERVIFDSTCTTLNIS